MRTSTSDLELLATEALVARGVPVETAALMAQEAVFAEVAGKRSHGVGKLLSLDLGDPASVPSVNRLGPVVTVDGNGGSGYAVMRQVAEVATEVVAEFGVAIASVRNFSRYSTLRPYTEVVANAGYVGILMQSSGPAAVAPFGSVDPITGPNPICFSFPTESGVRTFDFSTSEVVWGRIRQAVLEGGPLPPDCFLDAEGRITTVPFAANAVLPFGGAKGSALNIAIEILCGPLAGAKAGSEVESEFDVGAILIAIDPSRTGGGSDFPAAVNRLFAEITGSRPIDASSPVRLPGESSVLSRSRLELSAVDVEIPEDVLTGLRLMKDGQWDGSMASEHLLN